MKKLAIFAAVASLAIATPVFACPHSDKAETTVTAEKAKAKETDKAAKAKETEKAKDAKPDKTAKPTEKKTEKVSSK